MQTRSRQQLTGRDLHPNSLTLFLLFNNVLANILWLPHILSLYIWQIEQMIYKYLSISLHDKMIEKASNYILDEK